MFVLLIMLIKNIIHVEIKILYFSSKLNVDKNVFDCK